MMILLASVAFLSAAQAQAPLLDEGPVPLEQALDMGRWEAASRELIDGPAACVELQGEVDLTIALFTPGGWLGPGETRTLSARGTYEGTLDHGVWTRLIPHWTESEDAETLSLGSITTIVGRQTEGTLVPDGEGGERPLGEAEGELSISVGGEQTSVDMASSATDALGVLDEIMDSLESDVNLSYSGWDPDQRAIVLHQVVPMRERGDDMFQVVTLFPEGGPPTQLDAYFPKRVKVDVDAPFKVTLLNAQLHLRGTPTPLGVLPAEEGGSLVMGVLGYTFGLEHHLRTTRARPCPAAPSQTP